MTPSGTGWVRQLLRRVRSDPPGNSREKSLQEAADLLGVQLGEYYPDEADATVRVPAGIDDSLVVDQVDASREELLAYIARSRLRRRRLRLRLVQATAVGGSVAVGGVAVATSGILDGGPDSGSQRLPPRHWSQETESPQGSGAGLPRLMPEVILELPIGHARAVASAYVDLRGDTCTSIAFSRGGITDGQADVDCRSGMRTARVVRRRGAGFALSVVNGDVRLVSGYARPDLERILLAGPRAGTDKAISGVWTGERRNRRKLKVFLLRLAAEDDRAVGVFRNGRRLSITDLPGGRRPRSARTR